MRGNGRDGGSSRKSHKDPKAEGSLGVRGMKEAQVAGVQAMGEIGAEAGWRGRQSLTMRDLEGPPRA